MELVTQVAGGWAAWAAAGGRTASAFPLPPAPPPAAKARKVMLRRCVLSVQSLLHAVNHAVSSLSRTNELYADVLTIRAGV